MEPAVEADVHGEVVLAGGGQAAGQQTVDQPPVAGPRDTVPAQLDGRVPALEGGLCPLASFTISCKELRVGARSMMSAAKMVTPTKVSPQRMPPAGRGGEGSTGKVAADPQGAEPVQEFLTVDNPDGRGDHRALTGSVGQPEGGGAAPGRPPDHPGRLLDVDK